MWNELTSCIKRVVNDVFGEFKECGKAFLPIVGWHYSFMKLQYNRTIVKCKKS